jgi:hypothetical protein
VRRERVALKVRSGRTECSGLHEPAKLFSVDCHGSEIRKTYWTDLWLTLVLFTCGASCTSSQEEDSRRLVRLFPAFVSLLDCVHSQLSIIRKAFRLGSSCGKSLSYHLTNPEHDLECYNLEYYKSIGGLYDSSTPFVSSLAEQL